MQCFKLSRSCWLAALRCVVVTVAPVGSQETGEDKDGFRPLFNGKDLSGWVPVNTAPSTWSVKDGLAEELLALNDQAFCRELGRASENCLGEVLASSPRSAFPLRQRHAVDYVQPGVALVADAAHTIHPLAGQGINLGLQDVAVLAQEILASHARGIDPGEEALLRRYQRRRKGENLLMMGAMDGFKRLFEQEALPLRWLRNVGMRGVGQLPLLKQQLIRHAMGLG